MTLLTQEQQSFLDHHKISLSRVFDATNMKRVEYQEAMAALEMVIAIGTTPCTAAGHRLRTRAGHCAQCKPEVLAFMLRNDEAGEVYVAESKLGNVTKVGCSKNPVERMKTLNSVRYGGVSDWQLRFTEKCQHAGRIEFTAHKCLRNFAIQGSSLSAGRSTKCLEVFSCSTATAIYALKEAIQNPDRVILIEGDSGAAINVAQPHAKDSSTNVDQSVTVSFDSIQLPPPESKSHQSILPKPPVANDHEAHIFSAEKNHVATAAEGQKSSLLSYVIGVVIWGGALLIFITSDGSFIEKLASAIGYVLVMMWLPLLLIPVILNLLSLFRRRH